MLGGLTPSLGSIREARTATHLPIIVMIRPRAGGFCYSEREFKVMQRDAESALAEGVAGIAFGILTADGKIDIERCALIQKLAAGRDLVFHRAFDVVSEPVVALDELIGMGVTRVMTSGQEASAYNGAANIAKYRIHAAGRIEILPAGGINRFTVADVIERTGCDQVHASVSGTRKDASVAARPQVSFGGTLKPPEDEFGITDRKLFRTCGKSSAPLPTSFTHRPAGWAIVAVRGSLRSTIPGNNFSVWKWWMITAEIKKRRT